MLQTSPRGGRLLGCLCLTLLLGALGWLVLPASCRSRLEPTAHAATLTVTNTNDSGPGSLRQAIMEANGSPGPDTISFNFPQPGLNTISPAAPLPVIIDPVVQQRHCKQQGGGLARRERRRQRPRAECCL
jgi:hypothetical protein